MTKNELSRAMVVAQSDAELHNTDISLFDGFGLANFKPVVCTLKQLAALVRWQCVMLNGEVDSDALNELQENGRVRFQVVGNGSDDVELLRTALSN